MAIDPATFRLRYPKLASATDEQIAYWLNDAANIVTDDWGSDQEPASLAYAAHGLVSSGAIGTGGAAQIPDGVTSFKSGGFSVTFSDAAATASTAGGYGSTPYGRDFLIYLRRNVGGARLVGC